MLGKKSKASLLIAAALLGLHSAGSAQAPAGLPLNLVPWPHKVDQQPGAMLVTSNTRVVAATPALLPLAKILAGEIKAVTGHEINATGGKAQPGDIFLQIDSSLKGEAYSVTVQKNGTLVKGGDYEAVALGTTTILQAIVHSGDKTGIPLMTVTDEPAVEYRGLMLDIARKPHTIGDIKKVVELCRLYKTRYLHLHLTDDQLWTFPSTAYPLLGTKNDGGFKPYTLDELKDLVAYADERAVTLVPEFDVPGHSAQLVKTMPELFQIAGTKPYIHHASINFAKPEVMKAVETIIGEMCAVFKSSPYFHIGGDEADLAFAAQNTDFQALLKKEGTDSIHELYRKFLVDADAIVKKNGKKSIVWEGFNQGGKVKIPTDITVMAYEIRFYMPQALVDDGYKVINASWTPLYVVNETVRPPSEIFAWNRFQFKPFGAKPEDQGTIVKPTKNIIGSNLCAWEQPAAQEIPSLRGRLPAMIERVWNPDAGKDFDDFEKRFAETDKVLDQLIQ